MSQAIISQKVVVTTMQRTDSQCVGNLPQACLAQLVSLAQSLTDTVQIASNLALMIQSASNSLPDEAPQVALGDLVSRLPEASQTPFQLPVVQGDTIVTTEAIAIFVITQMSRLTTTCREQNFELPTSGYAAMETGDEVDHHTEVKAFEERPLDPNLASYEEYDILQEEFPSDWVLPAPESRDLTETASISPFEIETPKASSMSQIGAKTNALATHALEQVEKTGAATKKFFTKTLPKALNKLANAVNKFFLAIGKFLKDLKAKFDKGLNTLKQSSSPLSEGIEMHAPRSRLSFESFDGIEEPNGKRKLTRLERAGQSLSHLADDISRKISSAQNSFRLKTASPLETPFATQDDSEMFGL